MAHPRKILRAYVASILNGNTPAGANVFPGRTDPIWSTFPSIFIYSREETSQEFAVGTTQLMRKLRLLVEGRVKQTTNIDDDLDDLAEAIEEILKADSLLGGSAIDCSLVETKIEVAPDGDVVIGGIQLNYDITYQG